MLADLKKQSEDNNALFKDGIKGNGGIEGDALNSLLNEFKAFKAEMSRFRDDSMNNFKIINEILPTKADKNDLSLLEARIVEKLNDLIKQMYLQFADKAETKKKISNLEKNVIALTPLIDDSLQLKSLLELIMQRNT